MSTAELKSEVELNKRLITEGDVLFYIDDANCMRWEVTEVFDSGFEAKDDYETRDFYFAELQYGWRISDKTKANHVMLDKFQYQEACYG